MPYSARCRQHAAAVSASDVAAACALDGRPPFDFTCLKHPVAVFSLKTGQTSSMRVKFTLKVSFGFTRPGFSAPQQLRSVGALHAAGLLRDTRWRLRLRHHGGRPALHHLRQLCTTQTHRHARKWETCSPAAPTASPRRSPRITFSFALIPARSINICHLQHASPAREADTCSLCRICHASRRDGHDLFP